MATGIPLPAADPTALQRALLAEAFHLLLSSGRPVPTATLAQAVECEEPAVDQALASLERIGRTRRSAAGEVLGSLGLSIEPSPHELLLEVGRRYTWCALDAVGILGALDASGRIRSVSPATGAPIEIGFEQGRPVAVGGLVLFIPSATCRSVVDEWCPLVNFFEDDAAAVAWSTERQVEGITIPLAEATERATESWKARIVRRRPATGDGNARLTSPS